MGALSTNEIVEQSKAAYKQWAEQWREHAKIHREMNIRTTFMDFANIGVGRALLLVGNGYSLEEEIETIKKYGHNVDIMVCDKALGHLLDHGIKPQYVVVCDANVSYEKYLEPWKDQISESILFINSCGNPEWTEQAWKSKCLFVNMDAIDSQKEFGPLSGCTNFLPAATNVSNQMLVLATQSSNAGRNNWFGYDKIILVGYDYSWTDDGHYYAFDNDADGKRQYMSHAHCLDRAFRPCYSSSNLIFSAKWLDDYVNGYRLPVVSGTKRTLLSTIPTKPLDKQLQYTHKPHHGITVRGLSELKLSLLAQVQKIDQRIGALGQEHLISFRESI